MDTTYMDHGPAIPPVQTGGRFHNRIFKVGVGDRENDAPGGVRFRAGFQEGLNALLDSPGLPFPRTPSQEEGGIPGPSMDEGQGSSGSARADDERFGQGRMSGRTAPERVRATRISAPREEAARASS